MNVSLEILVCVGTHESFKLEWNVQGNCAKSIGRIRSHFVCKNYSRLKLKERLFYGLGYTVGQ